MERINKCPPSTNAERCWTYQQYYTGDRDEEQRRNGIGENHWSGAKSLEWYTGNFVRETMHGTGEYFWRHKGLDGHFTTYEGHFYGNCMHGYGVISYPDGRVFNGLLYNNMRWGPGIESNTNLQENVGLWREDQLVRLAWRPNIPSAILDVLFGNNTLQNEMESHRIILSTRRQNEVNNAIDLLKQCGADPVLASEKWRNLYPKHCNDLNSRLCETSLFLREYFKTGFIELEEMNQSRINKDTYEENSTLEMYYAWNNSKMLIDMMKHSFKHEYQRKKSVIDLTKILSGDRSHFKMAGKHEYDCRNLLMCSYLGNIHKVAQLINRDNVHPGVADVLGNTALMYAACGNQTQVIHFLVEAGADVNSFNDSCCTPLTLALIKFACVSKEVPYNAMAQSLSSPTTQLVNDPLDSKPSEWQIIRELSSLNEITPYKSISKTKLLLAAQKSQPSSTNMAAERKRTKSEISPKRKTTINSSYQMNTLKFINITEREIIKEENEYKEINADFLLQVTDLFVADTNTGPIPYLFEVPDMTITIEIDDVKLDQRSHEKNKQNIFKTNVTKVKNGQYVNPEKETSLTSAEKNKNDILDKTMSIIVQLLSDGADPRLVRCPQPALWLAVTSGSADLVRHLVLKGADVNETYKQAHGYSILDIAISGPLSDKNMALIQTILECGGSADHRLRMQDSDTPGPTLLHIVITKRIENIEEEKVCCEVLKLLLEHNADPLQQFRGSSAIDVAMNKSLKIFDVFIKSPAIDLNAVINENNETVLVKMFSLEFCKKHPTAERINTLSNLLLYGADPLLDCQKNNQKYQNLFTFAAQQIDDKSNVKSSPSSGHKSDAKIKKSVEKENPKKKSEKEKSGKVKLDPNSTRLTTEDIEYYKQELEFVKDSARDMHTRWIQGKLFKELLEIVEKYRHRHWNMILPEHGSKKLCGLWLTLPRCLEIWHTLKNSRKNKVEDRLILKHVLCIVQFYKNRINTSFKSPITAQEKDSIDETVAAVLQNYKIEKAIDIYKRVYIVPKLFMNDEPKFQICFECCLPLPEDKFECSFCGQVSFCSLQCMKINVLEKHGSHPCSENLKGKYFTRSRTSMQALVSS